jgi:hypothetical protein
MDLVGPIQRRVAAVMDAGVYAPDRRSKVVNLVGSCRAEEQREVDESSQEPSGNQ